MGYGTFLGINTALRGLLAQQAALDVTGHNIANVSTEGYTRQRVELTQSTPLSLPALNMVQPGMMGTGVEVTSFERLRDTFLDVTVRNQLSKVATQDTMFAAMREIEGAFGEPGDHALAAAMQSFFAVLDDVAAHPDDLAARQAFAQQGDALAKGFNELFNRLTDISTESDLRLNQAVTDINNICARIATLNGEIRDATLANVQPNDLLDERDRLMDELAGYINFTTTTNAATNEVTITFGTTVPINIVDPAVVGGVTPIARADLDTAYGNGDLTEGQCFADEDLFTTIIPAYMTDLDNLVESIVTQLDLQNAAGFDLYGNPGGQLFTVGAVGAPGWAISTVAFNAAVLADPRLVAAADTWNAPGEPGNGNNANTMLGMRSIVQAAPLSATWESFYSSIVANVGTTTSQAERSLANHAAVADSLQARRLQTSGVSMDEEMSNMLRFQHAYNASARMMTAFDEALDTLINRMGRVGL